MFGFDDADALRDELSRLREKANKTEEFLRSRVDQLIDLLGDVYSTVEPMSSKLNWEDSQTEFYARGNENVLMDQVKERRKACAKAMELIQKEFVKMNLDPKLVGTAANERRALQYRRDRAAQLRAEADRLDRE